MTPERNNYSASDVLTPFGGKEPIKLALFSSGLGTIQRGFEISTGRFYNALAGQEGLDVRLFCGSDFPGAKAVWNIGRQFWLSSLLKPFAPIDREKLWKLAYVLEQTTFSFGLLSESQSTWQPDVVWTKEVPLAHVLYEFRRLFNAKYKVIFANGGGFKPKTYQHFDFIQHLHPEAYEEALRYGIPAEKMNVLPNVVPYMPPLLDKASLRRKYNFAEDDYVIISVAAWNKHHKRMDYLLDEFRKLEDPRYKLIVCGQPEPEGESLREEYGELLGDRVRWMTVSDLEVRELLVMSDLFALCSLYEGLGAALIEAALAGLPVLCHPHGGGKYILQDERWLIDMSIPGNLSMKIRELVANPPTAESLARLKASVQQRFNEEELSHRFTAMVEQVLYEQPLIKSRAS
ncbi:MAG: glycosyltransferase family 4 protein [Candidatus Obscuribacterales bacterium]|jgi:glycosyltransferase involved in cell wall biosynthesis|nr:glycosyltransferase family 4 protein [Candidatus Obscuribacterales bacterium]